jgi:hypothetical protein
MGEKMTKAEWEKKNNYTKEHNCSCCKHSECIEKTPWDRSWKCEMKRLAGAGDSVKGSYSCDLWEHY